MTEKILLTLQSSGVAVITFNRPHVHNALDLEAMEAFAGLIERLGTDHDLRALILTGAGEQAFCSGGDLADLSRRRSEADAAAMIELMGDALLALENLPVPVIAAINGYALGGGGEIALACDLRVIDENARLGFVQAKRGLTPGWGGGQRLLRLVGYARAMDILLGARVLRPEELRTLGLANRLTRPGEALAGALELAQQFTQLDPNVIRSIKALLRAGLRQPYEEALATERALFPPLWVGETHVKSLEAFLNKQNEV
jgi:enoyl-CoA hydratase